MVWTDLLTSDASFLPPVPCSSNSSNTIVQTPLSSRSPLSCRHAQTHTPTRQHLARTHAIRAWHNDSVMMTTLNPNRSRCRGTHLLLGFDVECSDPDGTPIPRTPHAVSTPAPDATTTTSTATNRSNNEPNDQHHYYSVLSLPSKHHDALYDSDAKEFDSIYTVSTLRRLPSSISR